MADLSDLAVYAHCLLRLLLYEDGGRAGEGGVLLFHLPRHFFRVLSCFVSSPSDLGGECYFLETCKEL